MKEIRWFVLALFGLAALSVLHCQSSTGDENNSDGNGQTCNAPANLTAAAISDSQIRQAKE